MSLQDDIFDVRDALKKKPEKKGFDRLMSHMNNLETIVDEQDKILKGLRQGIAAVQTLMKGP